MKGTRLLITSALVAVACGSPADVEIGYRKPPGAGDGWETAYPSQVGMDPGRLLDLRDLISGTENHLIHSLLIVKDHRLVFEEYWPGVDLDPATLNPVQRDFERTTLHYVASVSKSITSALAGIAIDGGMIGRVDDRLFSFFPEHADLRTAASGQVTVAHLLAFSSGYDWNEFVYGFDDPRDSHNQMFGAPDPIEFLLGRPMVSNPGSEFRYNSGDTNILGEIVRRASSSSTLVEFARRNLFVPLGIDSYDWVRFPRANEVTFASGGASLRPRDMAKLGVLYLDGGVWNGRRVVSAEWVAASTRTATPLTGDNRTLFGYGYNWWLGRFPYRDAEAEYFRAAGWGGQDVFVFPSLDLIVVFTAGGFYESRPLSANDMIEQFILDAIVE